MKLIRIGVKYERDFMCQQYFGRNMNQLPNWAKKIMKRQFDQSFKNIMEIIYIGKKIKK